MKITNKFFLIMEISMITMKNKTSRAAIFTLLAAISCACMASYDVKHGAERIQSNSNPPASAAYLSAIQAAPWNTATRAHDASHHTSPLEALSLSCAPPKTKKLGAKELIKILDNFPPNVWMLIGQYAKITRKALPLALPPTFQVDSPGESLQEQGPHNKTVVVTNRHKDNAYVLDVQTGRFWDLGAYSKFYIGDTFGHEPQTFTYNKDGTRLLRTKCDGMVSELIDVTQLNSQGISDLNQIPAAAKVFERCGKTYYRDFAHDEMLSYEFPNGIELERNDNDRHVVLHDKDGNRIFHINSNENVRIEAVASDGDSFAMNDIIGTYSIWKMSTKKKIVEKCGNFCAFSPDGKHFASHCANKISLYTSGNAEKPILKLDGNRARFSPKGTLIEVCKQDESSIVYTLDGKELLKFPYQCNIAFSLDDTILYFHQVLENGNNLVEVYDVASGKKLLTIKRNDRFFNTSSERGLFSSDNRLITSPNMLWDISKQKPILPSRSLSLTSNGKHFKDFTKDCLWDVETRQPIIKFDFAIGVWYLRESPHGTHLFAITKENDKDVLRTYDLTNVDLNNFYKGRLNQKQTLLVWLLAYYAKNNPENVNIFKLIAEREEISESELAQWFSSFSTQIQNALIKQFNIHQEAAAKNNTEAL